MLTVPVGSDWSSSIPAGRHSEHLQALEGFAAEVIAADTRIRRASAPSAGGVASEVRRRATELAFAGQQIPQEFADANQLELHNTLPEDAA